MARLLLDTCVWDGAVAPLAELGHDIVWTGLWPEDPGDSAILDYAFKEDRILVTLDKDFGELAIVKGMSHSGMIRLAGFRTAQMAGAIPSPRDSQRFRTYSRSDHHRQPRARPHPKPTLT